MRDLCFAGEEALGDGFAHAGQGDDFFFPGDAVGGTNGGCGRRCHSPTPTGWRIFDVLLDDASAGAGAGDRGKIDPAGGGDFAGERRGFGPSGGGRCSGAGCESKGSRGRGRRGFRFFSSRSGLRCGCGVGRFAVGEDESNFVTDFNHAALCDVKFAQYSFVEGLHFHGGFVRLDFGQNVADFNLVTFGFDPFDESALDHGVAEFGHGDDGHGGK